MFVFGSSAWAWVHKMHPNTHTHTHGRHGPMCTMCNDDTVDPICLAQHISPKPVWVKWVCVCVCVRYFDKLIIERGFRIRSIQSVSRRVCLQRQPHISKRHARLRINRTPPIMNYSIPYRCRISHSSRGHCSSSNSFSVPRGGQRYTWHLSTANVHPIRTGMMTL